MARKNKKHKSTANNNITIVLSESLSSNEIKNILVEAMLDVEKHKAEAEQEKKNKELKERRKLLGIKEYPQGKKIHFVAVRSFLNRIGALFKLSFISKDKINGDWATTALLKSLLTIVFELAEVGLFLFSSLILIYVIYQLVVESITVFLILQNVLYLCFAFLFFSLSRIFRVASVEVENIDDKAYLFGVFASITSIVSIVVAIVSITK